MTDNVYRLGHAQAVSPMSLVQLAIAEPHTEWLGFPITRITGSGLVVGDGFAQCKWTFDYLTYAMVTALFHFIGTGASGKATIRTRDDLNVWNMYRAIMNRPKIPDEMSPAFLGYKDVTIRFTHLELVP